LREESADRIRPRVVTPIAANPDIGRRGAEFVLEFERQRLQTVQVL
jgi:hypothetical protein